MVQNLSDIEAAEAATMKNGLCIQPYPQYQSIYITLSAPSYIALRDCCWLWTQIYPSVDALGRIYRHYPIICSDFDAGSGVKEEW